MKKMNVLLMILLFSVSGLVMAKGEEPKKPNFDILSDSGYIVTKGVNAAEFFIDTHGHSKWYDVNDVHSAKGVKLDIFDCTGRVCNNFSDYKLVKVLTSGQSWQMASSSASNHWLGVVVDTRWSAIGSKFKWTVSSVPEPETVVLMLLGIFLIAVKSRSRKTTGRLDNLA